MENNISFTGINNLYLGKRVYNKVGSYILKSNVEQLAAKHTDLLIKCKLTDNMEGMDLTEFRKALDKCGDCIQAGNVKNTQLGNFELIINRSDISERNYSNVTGFKVNGCSVLANERKVLPLFTYLAALTRKLAAKADISAEQKYYFSLANRSIAQEATKYIESL